MPAPKVPRGEKRVHLEAQGTLQFTGSNVPGGEREREGG